MVDQRLYKKFTYTHYYKSKVNSSTRNINLSKTALNHNVKSINDFQICIRQALLNFTKLTKVFPVHIISLLITRGV